jgi:hypothetical protein
MTGEVVSKGWKIAGSLKNSYVYLAQDSWLSALLQMEGRTAQGISTSIAKKELLDEVGHRVKFHILRKSTQSWYRAEALNVMIWKCQPMSKPDSQIG